MTQDRNTLIIGSRESVLAVRQSELVLDYLRRNCPQRQFELLTMKTTGDRILAKRLDEIGGKGLFVKELDQALRDKRTDLSVHSLKDMPAEIPEDLPVIGFSEREDPRASLRAIAKGIDYIEHGFSILVFPEGTRARGGDMHEFKKGSLKLATKPGVPIVPISINGTYEVLEKDGYLHSAPIDVMVHPAIETKGLSRKEDKELTDKVYDIVRGGLMELKAMRQNQ